MAYKIIFCDLDGTALDEHAELSRENAEAIHALAARGILFVPTTGRALGEIPASVREHPDIRYFITSNGTAIWDQQEGRFIEKSCISGERLDVIRGMIPDYIILRNMHRNGVSCFDGPAFANYPYYSMTDYYHDCLVDFSEQLDDFSDELKKTTEVEMFALFFKYKEELQAFAERLTTAGGFHITSSTELALEITIAGAGKGAAIQKFAARMGVSLEETIGIGDSKNDITMLEAVGLGLAVENACDALKEHADRQICRNDEHPIRYVWEHIV
ncbi:MAG: HAD family phosphatase [Clostridia bacterium]|nr:HAD family phosphatase [Clostridia bacterium]